VVIRVTGKADTVLSSKTANTQTELDAVHFELEKSAKSYIDSNPAPKPIHTTNELVSVSGKIDPYFGGWYEVFSQWNLSGTSDFPVRIIGTYALQGLGRQSNMELLAYTEADRITKTNQITSQIQSAIQAQYNSLPKPTYPQNSLIDSGFIAYRGYGYNILTTMNITGNSDYPATVYVRYTTPLGTFTTLIMTAHNAAGLDAVKIERTNDAKSRIDLVLDNDKYAP
jgi:hypothetical protein